jgi:hypothetical protein
MIPEPESTYFFKKIMIKYIVFTTVIALQLIWQSGLVYAKDLGTNSIHTHSAYKITSYNLGAIKGFQGGGILNPAQDFKPLFITSSAADILNSEHQKTVSAVETTPGITSNLSSIGLSAEIDATDKISLQGTFGLTRNLWTPDLFESMNGSSWEANLGIVYKLLDNISYELHFGYMDTGDLFTNRSSYTDVENIIMISNQLTLSF